MVRPLCLLLIVVAGLMTAPVGAESGLDWFDAQTGDLPRAEPLDAPPPAAGRARFMACGYVAPGLDAMEPADSGSDRAFAQMLERMKAHLRRLGAAP